MLVRFAVKNYRSFSQEQACTYSATADHTHESTHCVYTGLKAVPRLSKVAAIFGPNCSGKSNLIAALSTLRALVLNSTDYSKEQFADCYSPFLLGPTSDQPTEFDIEVLLGAVRYRYAVSFNSQRIIAERLQVFCTGKSQRWFDRHFDIASQMEFWSPFSPGLHGPREKWRRATQPRSLFLTIAAQHESEHCAVLLRWFEQHLEILSACTSADIHRAAVQMHDARYKQYLLDVLNSMDIKVDDVRLVEAKPATHGAAAFRSPSAVIVPHLEFLHATPGWSPVWMHPTLESAGMHRLVWLIGRLFDAIKHGRLLVIDEFDVGLHPLVARFLIGLVNDRLSSGKTAQLLVTNYDITLMDVNILRRDQIWLIERDSVQSSVLSRVSRLGPRKQERLGKAYLAGRYGALPFIRRPIIGAALRQPE